jgi:hypothetical protein
MVVAWLAYGGYEARICYNQGTVGEPLICFCRAHGVVEQSELTVN